VEVKWKNAQDVEKKSQNLRKNGTTPLFTLNYSTVENAIKRLRRITAKAN